LAVWALVIATKDSQDITTLNPRAIAKHLNVRGAKMRRAIQLAWDALFEPDPLSTHKDEQGRRLIPLPDSPGRALVVTGKHYRKMVQAEQSKEADAERQKRYRSRQKALAAAGKRKISEEAERHGSPTAEEAKKAFEEEPVGTPVEALVEDLDMDAKPDPLPEIDF